MSNLEIKQGENKFYIGDDENNALAEITYHFAMVQLYHRFFVRINIKLQND